MTKAVVYKYENGVESSTPSGEELAYKGKKPQNGEIKANKSGQIGMAIHDGKYCAEKSLYNSEVIISEKNQQIVKYHHMQIIPMHQFLNYLMG